MKTSSGGIKGINMRIKIILAVLVSIMLVGLLCFLFLPPFPNPIYSYFTTQKYKHILNGKWKTYNNTELNITFDYPSEWQVHEGNGKFCKPGKGLVISPKNSDFYPRSALVLCKTPNIDTQQTIANVFNTVKKIETPYKTFYSSVYSNNEKAIFVRDVISEDKTITIDVQVPFPSDQSQQIVEERDKIMLRLLNSIRDSK